MLIKPLTTWKMTMESLLIVKKLHVGIEIISSEQKFYLFIDQELYCSYYFIYFLWSSAILFCHDTSSPLSYSPRHARCPLNLFQSLPENGQRESYTLFQIRCFRALHNGTNASLALVGISHQKPQGPTSTFPRPHCQASSQPLPHLLFSHSQLRHLSTAVFTTQFHLLSTTHPQSHCALSV